MTLFSPHKQKSMPSSSRQPSSQAVRSATGDGQSFLGEVPRDARRLDFRHYLIRSLFGLYCAPLTQDVTRLLDVASGTGRWGHEMAHHFPHVTVVGVDRDDPPSKPEVPANYQFVKANVFQGLPFQDGEFQYVHQRFLGLVTPAAQWPLLLRELVRVTELRGYVELRESSASFQNMGPLPLQVRQWRDEASTKVGIDLSLMTHLLEMLAAMGLREIKHQTENIGIGTWAGHRGMMVQTEILASLCALM